jgi:ADP-ribosyl-[dinitrogen reductase] hydrolase
MPTFEERLSGGLIGLLVGDALGVPYEFHDASEIPSLGQIEFDPPPGFNRAHAHVKPGTWSDDGAQALCLLASLLHCGHFDAQNFANRLVNWMEHGYMAVDGDVFDVGVQTARAIQRLQSGVPPLEAGGTDEYSQGNGSLMRVLPLALWHQGSDAELVRDAHDQSKVTHGHVTVQACCALYCLWARRTLEGAPDAWNAALESLRAVYRDHPAHLEALESEIRPDAERTVRGSGFVLDCLFSAKHALLAGSYQAVVKAAISLGQDTDTTACVAGGIAGIRDGIDAIPLRWRDHLRGWEDLGPLRRALLEHWE